MNLSVKKNSNTTASYFDKNITNIIKGVALIIMFIHHMFTFPDAYVDGISYPALEPYARWLCNPFNICVSIFAFMTGYCYFFAKSKTYRYAFRKITDFLLTYWFVYILFLIIALLLGGYEDITIKSFVLELFALNRVVMVFCWYVPFYIASMLILTFASKCSANSRIREILFMLVFPVLSTVVLAKFVGNSVIAGNLENISEWFPCIAIGYICASGSLFQRVFDKILNLAKWKTLRLIISISLAVGVFLLRHYVPKVTLFTFSLMGHSVPVSVFADVIYAPVFVYAVVNIVRLIRLNIIWNIIGEIGKYSLYMWFLHCIFFNVSKDVFQPILYFPKNPVLVVLWGLLLCYASARIIDVPLKKIINLKNELTMKEKS